MNLKLIGLSLVVLLVAAATPASALPGEKFDLEENTDGVGNRIMYQLSQGPKPTTTQPTGVVINGCQIWRSDIGAEVAHTTPAVDVEIQLDWALVSNVNSLTVEIGRYSTIGGFEPVLLYDDTANVPLLSTSYVTSAVVAYPGQHFLDGEFMAVQICVELANAESDAILSVDGGSWIDFIVEGPFFPIPELASLLFTGIGLAGIAGLAVVGRRRRQA